MNNRIERVLNNMKDHGLSQLIVSDPKSIKYLTGIEIEPYERLFAFLIKEDGKHIFFLNNLFTVPKTTFEEVWFSDTDDSIGMIAEKLSGGTLGIDKTWAARFLIPLMERRSDIKVVLGSDCVDDSRAIKDDTEISIMKKASEINDTVMHKALDFIKEGMTEKQVADFIDAQFIKEGATGSSFTTIVSFAGNGADPHHEPDDTVLKKGDAIVIDQGCMYEGYASDMTRSVVCGEPSDPEYKKVHDLVRQANEKAESIIKPGVKLCDIDAAARDLITDAGYGVYFNHRLGHFIGQTDHEQGDVSSVNQNTVKPGMIFSIEPGIYLPDRFGVRIEDLVLVTEEGCEVLNHEDKHLKSVGD